MSSLSPPEVWAHFRAWAVGRLSAATIRNYERLIERWLATLPAISAAELKAYHLLSWGRTWHELQAVKRVWYWAAGVAELLDRDPFAHCKLPPAGQRHRTVTRSELARLVWGSRRDFRLYLLAVYHTIARPQEIREVTWHQLRWRGSPAGMAQALSDGEACWLLADYKARRRRRDPHSPRCIPIPAALGRLLALQIPPADDFDRPVFLTAAGDGWTKEAVRLRMHRLRCRLGLGEDGAGEPIVCYSLRHTGATEAAAAGVRDRLLADLMGHTTTRTTARYQHLDMGHIAAASRILAQARKNGRPGSRRTHDLVP